MIKWAVVPGQAQQGNFGHGDTHGNRFNNPDGKNPGDILRVDVYEMDKMYDPRGQRLRTGLSYKQKWNNLSGKNPGDFWNICTKPFKDAHFAVYPEAICVNPILSSCPPNGVVLDPMCGSGTTLVVAKKLGRNFIGIELNPSYVEMTRKRLEAVPERLDIFLEEIDRKL